MEYDYDDVVRRYNVYRRKGQAIWLQEEENVRRVMEPLVRGKRVLELACGNGFYTFDLLEWGAERVLATDISNGMLYTAREQLEAAKWTGKVEYLQADCSKPRLKFPGSPFDLVFASKLLTHAPDRETMAQMFRTAADNLVEGGVFVSVNSPVNEDPKAYFEQERAAIESHGLLVNKEFVKEIPDGIQYKMSDVWPGNKQSADHEHHGYRLRKSVYEAAARDGGFAGDLTWEPLLPPSSAKGADLHPAIKKQLLFPDVSILVAKKK